MVKERKESCMTCSHQFVIPPPNGPISIGVCRVCGETRDMENYIDEKYQGWRGVPKNAKKKTLTKGGA